MTPTHGGDRTDKPGCSAPMLGRAATQARARPLTGDLAAHVAACLACRLERIAYERLDERAVTPSRALIARVLLAARHDPERD